MIELIDVHKGYPDKKGKTVRALKGISYRFPDTGLIFIVGKSGSGKSTMLNLLGLLDNYDEGQLLIDGKPSNDLTERERDTYRALNIGFVFQEFHIIDKYTIGKNISLALEIGQQEVTDEQIAETLGKVGLAGFENRFARGVSGGQKQRVAIARAIIKNPKIVLADEPTGNLDSVTCREIFELLRELSKENLVIVISHDIESAHRYADEIVELSDGKIVDIYNGDGTTDTVRMTVDKVDQKQINELLDSGKKVVLVKKPKTPTESQTGTQTETQSTPQTKSSDSAKTTKQLDLNTRTRLPFMSSLKLSFLAMRAKWVRMTFTILLSMFAVTFFGFADMIGRFSLNSILAEDIEKQGLPFIPFSAFVVDDDGFFTTHERVLMDERHQTAFGNTGLDYATQFWLPHHTHASVLFHEEFFPGTPWTYWGQTVHGVIEAEGPGALGLDLVAGRWPEPDAFATEIVITNFMLERYKLFGIVQANPDMSIQPIWGRHRRGSGVGNNFNYTPGVSRTVESFDDIYGITIAENLTFGFVEGWYRRRLLRIVGMVEFDISRYESVSSINTPTRNITDDQRDLLRRASQSNSTVHNNFFALPGFHYEYMRHTNHHHLHVGSTLSLGDNSMSNQYNRKIDGFLPGGNQGDPQSTTLDPAFVANLPAALAPGSVPKMVLSANLLWSLLSQDKMDEFLAQTAANPYDPTHAELREALNKAIVYFDVFNKTLDFSIDRYFHRHGGNPMHFAGQVTDIQIVGVHWWWGNEFFACQNFYDQLVMQPIVNFLVPAETRGQRTSIMSTVNNRGGFTLTDGEDEQAFIFRVTGGNTFALYQLENMFSLFISIFRLASLVFALFAILLTYSFIAASINARKRDMGILRSLGAGRMDIVGIFTKEGVIIAALKIIFACVLCFVGFYFVNRFFISQLGYIAEAYTLISFGWRQVLLMGAVTIGGVIIAIAIPIIRIARKQPVQVIRDVQN